MIVFQFPQGIALINGTQLITALGVEGESVVSQCIDALPSPLS